MSGAIKEFRFIDVTGCAKARGEQYGEQAKEEIRSAIEAYKEHFSAVRNLTWDYAVETARMNSELIEGKLPEQFEEMKGIAAGSGIGLDDVLALNNRYEFLHFPHKRECTAFALLRVSTADSHIYAGQNWDQRPFAMKHTLIIRSVMPDGARCMGLTEAGQLIRNGISSTGVALCANSLRSSLDKLGPGIPVSILRRFLLGLGSSSEMRDRALAAARSVSSNYMMASVDDTACNIEAVPGREAVSYPKNGILTHANNLLNDPSIDISKDKRFRGERLYELLNRKNGVITRDYIMECLKDHEGLPEAICSHISAGEGTEHKLWQTNASIIYDLDELKMWVCAGPPCEGEYKEYSL
ncbi:MAG: C45 family peptidase [Clostridiales bacterium]|jgi:isopenicillin-N N-acyltransferase-like protein|nr:C45 family peptidase [Clostridiales bacterium]